jgi:hypothetical protein
MYDDPSDPDNQRVMLHSEANKERTLRELAKLDEQTQLFLEAEQVFTNLETTKDRYLQVLDSVIERERSILALEGHVDKLFKANASKQSKYQDKADLKVKINAFEQEMKGIIETLESKEQLLSII